MPATDQRNIGLRNPGRPRDPDLEQAILRAAATLLAEVGVEGLTVAAVARRAGVARATIYLRWPTRGELLGATARAAAGGAPYPLTGDLEIDIRTGAAFARDVMAAPNFLAALPGLVSGIMADPPRVQYADIVANRPQFAAEYRANATAQGFDPDADPDLAFDILVGAQLAHILATGDAPSAETAAGLAELIVRGLRAPETATEPPGRRLGRS